MAGQLFDERELLDFECSDGSRVIITTIDDSISFEDCNISTLVDVTPVLEVFHKTQDEHGNIILHAQNYASGNNSNSKEIAISSSIEPVVPPSPVESESDNEYHKCTDCSARFVSKKALKFHKSVHVDEALYACEFCSASSIHWSEMWQHQCSNSDCTPLVCPNCKATVSTKKQLQIHEEVHNLQRRFTSKRMDGYFKRKLQEAEDPEIDWGAKPFICGVCGKQYLRLYEVEYHEKLHTGERQTPNVCGKCGISYINRHDLTKHSAMGCTNKLSRKTGMPFERTKITLT